MVTDLKDIVPFLTWLPGAAVAWLTVVLVVAVCATVLGWLVAAARHGPGVATRLTFQVWQGAVLDIALLSPRRAVAMAWLAIKESIRRRVVVVFAVFILLLSFAGWFLDPGSPDPARLYLDFVLTATSYLVLLLALFLSSLSLPADLKNRTLQTIVTKPVRASEIVLGRILGFTAVGTLLLAVMCGVSYAFVQRGLAHTHKLTADVLQPVEASVAGQSDVLGGNTDRVNQHRHKVTIDANGNGYVQLEQGHTHALTAHKDGDKVTYSLGPAEGLFAAKVPIYGRLAFRDRTGNPAASGINVGDEWAYRGFIDGGTLAACVWTFDGITEEAFPDGLPLEMTIEVFRSEKGDIEKGVPGSLAVRNPRSGEKVEIQVFESKEFKLDKHRIPRQFQTPDGKKVDLFKDFVDNGKVEIWLQCVAPAQYFGAAQADVYLLARNASFPLNFAKGYLGIWLQMLLITAVGVLFSTFLSGPIAMLATLGALLGGFFDQFMLRVATGHTWGGGPFESLLRLWTQENATIDLEPGVITTLVVALDQPAALGLRCMAAVLPDFGRFSFSNYVASGFDISGGTLLMAACRALAFVVPVFIVGYLCLKNREIGR